MKQTPPSGPFSQTPHPDTGTDAAQGVGALLRASRMRFGERLDDVASVLRIRERHLEALEEGRIADLPGTTYAVGFVRAYAEHLGLDAEEVVRRFKDEFGSEVKKSKARLVLPEPVVEAGVPKGAIVFLGLLVGVLAYGGWYLSSVDNAFYKEWIAPIPDRLAALIPSDTAATQPENGGEMTQAPSDQPADAPLSVPKPVTSDVPADQQRSSATTAPSQAAVETTVTSTANQSTETEAATIESAATEESAVPDSVETAVSQSTTAIETAVEQDAAATAQDSQPDFVGEPVSAAVTVNATTGARIGGRIETAETAASSGDLTGSTSGAGTIAVSPGLDAPGSDTTLETARLAPAETPVETPVETLVEPPVENSPSASLPPSAQGQTNADAAVTSSEPESRIVLRAKTDSWIKVYEPETGDRFIEKLLPGGATYAVPIRDSIVLDTGDAGALEILVDGALVPPIGGSGDVVRRVALNPESLKQGTPTIVAPPVASDPVVAPEPPAPPTALGQTQSAPPTGPTVGDVVGDTAN